MFFKSTKAFLIDRSAITGKLELNETTGISEFEACLHEFSFKPPTEQQTKTVGFVPPLRGSALLCHQAEGYIMLALKVQWKDIPATALNDHMQPRIKTMEAEKCRPLNRKELQEIKEDSQLALLPNALCKSKTTYCFINVNLGLVVVDTTSSPAAEDFFAMVRKALGSWPVLPWFDAHQLSGHLQTWITNKALPEGLELGHAVQFKAPDEEGATAKFNNHLLSHDEVQAHLEDKRVVKLALGNENVSFSIDHNGTLSGIKFSDIFRGTNAELGWDDIKARFDADFLLMADQISKLCLLIRHQARRPLEDKPDALAYALEDDETDYKAAYQFVVSTRRCSVSALQRHLRIGYNRAARLIERLEIAGVVSTPGHLGSREVLVSE